MRFWIEHETRLEFSTPVYEHHCELRLFPRAGPHQRVFHSQLEVEPHATLFAYDDPFDNRVQAFDVLAPHQTLVTRVRSEVETTLQNPFDFQLMSPARERRWYRDRLRETPFLWQYVVHRSPAAPEWSSLDLSGVSAAPDFDKGQSAQVSLMKALEWAGSVLAYQPGTSETHSALQQAVSKRQGVCQDFAHLFLALVRSWELPARYVMGYMNAGIAGREEAHDDPASHAWVEVLLPGAGWRGFDPTNRLCSNELYIPLAVGRDSHDAAPQRGTFKGIDVKQHQSIRVALDQHAPDTPSASQSQQQVAQ